VVDFASVEDRDFYVSSDPVHQAFVKKNGSKFDDVRVIDYEKGIY
jgi:Stress responsive A/B Barrel Domain